MLATTISQELAHALGLCHNDDEDGIMYPSVTACFQEWECADQVDSCYCEGQGYDPYCPGDYLDELLGPSAPDTTPPSVAIVTPQTGQTIPGDFTLSAEISDDRGITSVDLYDNDEVVASDSSPPFEWPETNYPQGEHVFAIVAYDEAGNAGEDSVTVVVDWDFECTRGDCCCGDSCCEEDCSCADLAPTGAPCDQNEDCQGNLCLVRDTDDGPVGVCTQTCGGDDPCPRAYRCVEVGDHSVCVSDPSLVLGDDCVSSIECGQGVCLIERDDDDEGTCSIECDSGECPDGYACESVKDREVCRPDGSGRGGGGGRKTASPKRLLLGARPSGLLPATRSRSPWVSPAGADPERSSAHALGGARRADHRATTSLAVVDAHPPHRRGQRRAQRRRARSLRAGARADATRGCKRRRPRICRRFTASHYQECLRSPACPTPGAGRASRRHRAERRDHRRACAGPARSAR